jgi:hypothetical protein
MKAGERNRGKEKSWGQDKVKEALTSAQNLRGHTHNWQFRQTL